MTIDELRGTIGIWTNLVDRLRAADVRRLARAVEELGYHSLWFPEARGREAFTQSALLLEATDGLVVGPGVANVWARDPMAMVGAATTLAEAFEGRFVLGLGVSHRETVTQVRGHDYAKPLRFVRDYLAAMDRATYMAPRPERSVPRLLAALGPKMLRVARELCDGAMPYLAPVHHTAIARQTIGPGKLLVVVQMAVLEEERIRADELARGGAARYLSLANYTNNLRRFGFSDEDFTGGGSDRLLEAVVARGDASAVAARVRDQREAGADLVCLQILTPDMESLLDRLASLTERLRADL